MKKTNYIINRDTSFMDYETADLYDGWYLHYQKDIPVCFCDEKNRAVIIGYAWQCMPNTKKPQEVLNRFFAPQDVVNMRYSLCGAFTIIENGKIYTDMMALLPVFYTNDTVSNELSCICECPIYKPETTHGRFPMDWCPSPLTPNDNVKRLLPSQVYNYKTGEIEAIPLIPDETWAKKFIVPERSLEEQFNVHMSVLLKNIYEDMKDKQILIPLTGGYDSRLMLAECLRAEIPVEAFTMYKSDMNSGDKNLPPEICKKVNVKHTMIYPESEYIKDRYDKYTEVTHGMSMGQDRKYYANKQYEKLNELYGDVVLLRGGGATITSEPYYKKLSNNVTLGEVISLYGLTGKEKYAIKEYLMWTTEHDFEELPTSAKFYLEQRGTWLADVDNGFKLYDNILPIEPLNCSVFHYIMNQYSFTDRQTKKNEYNIILSACKEIGEIPYAKHGFTEKVQGKINGILEKFKKGETYV